jgi:hypothetical protein
LKTVEKLLYITCHSFFLFGSVFHYDRIVGFDFDGRY